MNKRKDSPEQTRQLLELRRSNAACKHVNKKKYNRKRKKDRRYEF